MKSTFLIALAFCFLATSCTTKPEDKVAQALEKALGKEEIKKQMDIGLTKLLGKKETPFRQSVSHFFVENTKLNYSDIKIEGDKATVKLTVQKPNEEEFAGLFFMAAFIERKKLDTLTLDQFLAELSKGQRKTASTKDFRIDQFEGTVELKKTSDSWTLDEKSAKSFYSKKNKKKAVKK
jgi:hypothetical protein